MTLADHGPFSLRRLDLGPVIAATLIALPGTAFAQVPAGPPQSGSSEAVVGIPGSRPNPVSRDDPGRKRLDGLHIGERGFSSGRGGGLDLELTRNNDLPPLPPLAANVARPTADPHDLSGSWFGDQFLGAFEILRDMYGEDVPFNALGRKVMDRRLLANDQRRSYMTPASLCRPSGPDWDTIHMPIRIYQSRSKLDIFSTMDRMWWPIALDPTLLPPASKNSYMGRSIGRWDGDSLVVENTGFRTRRWLSFRGTPISPAGKLTYRITKRHEGDHWLLEIVTTVDDPTYYNRPWKFARTLQWRPDAGLLAEYDCEDQSDGNDSGAVPEPNE
ncbi:hypothetical protein WSK_1821 [Novosphingobium sp. Rr 2-17]|uniref:hypothetical protein n=1 Tax=Novosphingobium sp. Rr 2-17 TaxID=555793 RepID=UPI000269AB38|nr:hypothetical protein [Novosphingobium sp. Rr 2-17]EIZ79588.1 hypothetical protein WSK_1821 [Novosphingobium sp. Rr 2-17]